MKPASVSPIWVGFADFAWQMATAFLVLFILMLANFSQQESLGNDCAKALKQAIATQTDFPQVFVDESCTVRFKDPQNQFATGSSELSRRFREDLDRFIPIYIGIINSPQFHGRVKEVHIDGHTSSIWDGRASDDEAYFKNMNLSNARSLNTLQYILANPLLSRNSTWYRAHFVNNGYASSRPIVPDPRSEANQRVEFKVLFDAP